MWVTPMLLIIPNIWLDLTETYTYAEKTAGILLPLGIYLLLLAAWRRHPVTTLCLIPVMVLCAFQIVLLFLYGESIIAIDMFLNVLTTNVHEATELLRNLSVAIAVVCIIYLPPIITAIIGTIKKWELDRDQRHAGLVAGAAVTAAGAAACIWCILQPGGYAPQRRLFPVNVTSNIFTAAERTMLSDNYYSTSEPFSFGSVDSRPDDGPEVYLLVIGETARADNWEINGYSRPTNPRLSRRSGLISYPKALSESNTTHKSVPLLMSHLDAASFGDSIYQVRSIIDAFGEAGYTTLWISDQQRNGSLIDFFGSRADHAHFLTDDKLGHQDMELCGYLRDELDSLAGRKLFIVLHTYGSHFNYKERYSAPYAVFGPEGSAEASVGNRPGLINAYDNTIVYTDAVLDSIMTTVEQTGHPAALFNFSFPADPNILAAPRSDAHLDVRILPEDPSRRVCRGKSEPVPRRVVKQKHLPHTYRNGRTAHSRPRPVGIAGFTQLCAGAAPLPQRLQRRNTPAGIGPESIRFPAARQPRHRQINSLGTHSRPSRKDFGKDGRF